MHLSKFTPSLCVECANETFFMSKMTWMQFAYLRVLFNDKGKGVIKSECDDLHIDDLHIQSHAEFSPFFKFISGQEDIADDILLIRDIALQFGIDVEGRLASRLTTHLYRWATSYAVTQECQHLIEYGCAKSLAHSSSSWFLQKNPFRKTHALRDAVVASVLPIVGDAMVDMRNIHVITKLWTSKEISERETSVRAFLKIAFDGDD